MSFAGRTSLLAIRQGIRQFSTNAVRRSGMEELPPPGYMLPFQLTRNPYLLTFKFIVFWGSGFAMPFILVRHTMLKK